MNTQEMKAAIEAKIQRLVDHFGYTRKEAEQSVENALKLVIEGKKKITDIIEIK